MAARAARSIWRRSSARSRPAGALAASPTFRRRIEAWGGDGGRGASAHGGDGGAGGYAQTTTTVDHLREFFGTSELYYYLGKNGSGLNGGGGGTGTLVTVNNLTQDQASFGTTLALAGGGGGGGAGRQASVCKSKQVYGAAGGAGGEAI